jgi:exodeoxyribonuclease V alpha subunit
MQSFIIQKLGVDNYYGFELNKDGRFLLGDFLVTHNTSCLNEIINLIKGTYVVCSFTGKAVARTREFVPKENTGTIHSILMRNAAYDHIIIDEASMLPLELFHKLIERFPNTYVTFIGDNNQLQPIQWGSLFYSLIESKTIPVARLVKNHRVSKIPGEKNGIIMNANLMLDPNARPFSFIKTDNFKFIEGHKAKVIELIKAFKEIGTTTEEMVILTPYNETSNDINPECQKLFNNSEEFVIDSKGKQWYLNDRVMMTKNSLQGVYNGEIGTIVQLHGDHIDVDFGNSRIMPYMLDQCFNDGNEEENVVGEEESYFVTSKYLYTSLLTLAFCLTVDKSQGSEWEMVIFYIPRYTNSSFLNNNRIYTAITRAKQMVYIVSPSNKALYSAVEKKCPKRHDNIVKRLKVLLPEIKENKVFQEEDMESIMNSMMDDDFD